METANLRGVVLTVVSTVLGGCELPPLLVDTYGPERVSLYGAPVAMSERDASSGRWLPFDGGLPRSNGPRAEREGMFSHWGYYGSAVPEGALLGFVLGSASEGSQLVMTRARPVDERETRSARVEWPGVWMVFEGVPEDSTPDLHAAWSGAAARGDGCGLAVRVSVPVRRIGTGWMMPDWESISALVKLAVTEVVDRVDGASRDQGIVASGLARWDGAAWHAGWGALPCDLRRRRPGHRDDALGRAARHRR